MAKTNSLVRSKKKQSKSFYNINKSGKEHDIAGEAAEVYSPTIKELPAGERPRERLAAYGASALSLTELLAIVLRSGTRRFSVLRVAEKLFARFRSVEGIASASVNELCAVRGVGEAKAIQIKAAIELGRRFLTEGFKAKVKILSPKDAADLVIPELRYQTQEHFQAIFLDTKNQLLKKETIFIGSLSKTLVHPREIFSSAIAEHAAHVILVHNHPSGDTEPSEDDKRLTKRLLQVGETTGISVIDHIIVGGNKYFSMKETGMITNDGKLVNLT